MLVLLIGCPWVDRDDLRDRDGDGFAAAAYAGDDCDDGDPAVGAPTLMTYLDADADGFGDPGSGELACAQGERVLDGSDCDDADADWFPVELWPDDDGDGAGSDALGPPAGCEGGTWSGGDCDDDNPGVGPGVRENCFDGIDQDCNGVADDCSAGEPLARGVGAGTQFGQSAIVGADIDGDGAGDLIVGVPTRGALVGFTRAAVAEARVLTEADIALNGSEFGSLGGTALAVGRPLGDGTQVLVVGAPATEGFYPRVGFLPLPAAGAVGPTWWLEGQAEQPYNAMGVSVAIGDIEGDGSGEIVAGDPNEGWYCGGAYVLRTPLELDRGSIGTVDDFWGDPSGEGGVVRISSRCDDYADPLTSELLGSTVAMVPDAAGSMRIALAAPMSNRLVENGGHVVLVGGELGAGGTAELADRGHGGVAGVDSGADFGHRLAAADLDGDSVADLLISAPAANGMVVGAGAVYVLFDAAAATETAWTAADAVPLTLLGTTAAGQFGAGLAVLDHDGDGNMDVAVGAPDVATGLGDGAVVLFYGPFGAGTLATTDADRAWAADATPADLGWFITAGPLDDVVGDELIAGAPAEGNGAVYLLR